MFVGYFEKPGENWSKFRGTFLENQRRNIIRSSGFLGVQMDKDLTDISLVEGNFGHFVWYCGNRRGILAVGI